MLRRNAPRDEANLRVLSALAEQLSHSMQVKEDQGATNQTIGVSDIGRHLHQPRCWASVFPDDISPADLGVHWRWIYGHFYKRGRNVGCTWDIPLGVVFLLVSHHSGTTFGPIVHCIFFEHEERNGLYSSSKLQNLHKRWNLKFYS